MHVTQMLEDGLRSQDIDEIEALGRDPKVSLSEGFALSEPHCYAILVNERAAGMFGVVPTATEGTGVIWMLATDRILASRRELVIEARRWLLFLNRVYPILVNAVDTRNTVALEWLEVMEFTLGQELPLPNGVVFRSFSRCANPSALELQAQPQ